MEKSPRLVPSAEAGCSHRAAEDRRGRKTFSGLTGSLGVPTWPGIARCDYRIPQRYLKRVTGNVPVTTEEAAGSLPEIGNDHNIGLVISGPAFNHASHSPMSLDAPRFVFP